MRTISIEKSTLVALVDDADYTYLTNWTWCIANGYVQCTDYSTGLRKLHYMHCLLVTGAEIDHIDGNPLNNQRSNLRAVTRTQNNANRRVDGNKTATTTSQYKGVCWNKGKQNWHTQIKYLRHKYHIGYFHNEIDAAKAYNEAAIRFFGEFARINEL